MPSEFDLIRRHFARPVRHSDLGGGDDGALIRPRAGHQVVASTDMLVAGRHFFPDAAPDALGWKTLAVNLSDIAAMGARPRWALLSLALPTADEDWLARFADGLYACADAFEVDLIGGDTTRGPLTLNVTALGELPAGSAILRNGARIDDELWISGQPGAAALALWHRRDGLDLSDAHIARCLDALDRPHPRVALGCALTGLASAMLDVSDGLLGDLGHLLNASGTGATLDEAALPLTALVAACGDSERARDACLRGGDDYELLFTAHPDDRQAVLDAGRRSAVALHRIGRIVPAGQGLTLRQRDGQRVALSARGFDHFATN